MKVAHADSETVPSRCSSRDMSPRLHLLATVFMILPAHAALAQPARDIGPTFLAGAYFDMQASPGSHLITYLVSPIAGGASKAWRGTELTKFVRSVLGQGSPFVAAARLDLSAGSQG